MPVRFLLLFLSAPMWLASSAAATPPNIVFVLTDDQAPWAIGASGNKDAPTPNMDRLAREGAYLRSSFVVTPVCSPSRAALMTSRYGSELGITDWIHPRREPELGLDPELTTWPEVLQAAGYKTGLVGKWHLGVPDRFHPTKMGFDEFMGFREGGTKTANPTLEVNGEPKALKGLTADILTDEALGFLDRHKEKPFLLCLHYRAPHTRWLPVADEDMAPLKDRPLTIPNPEYPQLNVKRVERMMREYIASVRSVDRNLGRLLEKLDELKLSSSTIVIFTSDHGYNMGHNGIWHKGNGHWVLNETPPATENIPRGQRPNMYDHSLRVPTIVRWPGTTKPGALIDRTVTSLDWYPTIVAMAQQELPQDSTIRGRSFVPLLKGDAAPDWNDDLYAEYSTHHQSRTHMRMYRTRRWKLVRDFLNAGRDELYDLQSDGAESNNLINSENDEHQRVRRELDAKILAAMHTVDDDVLKTLEKESTNR